MTALVLEPTELRRLAELIQAEIGVHFDESHWPDLLRHLKEMMNSSANSNPKSFLRWLFVEASASERVATLAAHLTIGETYFYREPALFSLLQTELIPARIQANSRQGADKITIWSAGCSSGEEPYSIAIAVSQLPGLAPESVQILGSDVNDQVLAKAAAGVYSSWSFRNPPANLLANYFTPVAPHGYQLSPVIRERVRFLRLNLLAASYPEPLSQAGGVDLIFCRNVLMYFDRACRARIVERFVTLLDSGGWLIVSPSETAVITHPQLHLCRLQGIHLFRKGARASRPRVEKAVVPARVIVEPVAVAAKAAALAPTHLPASAEEIAQAARVQADLGALAAAGELYLQAIALDKLNPLYYFHRAMILQALSRPEEAALFFKKAIFLDPDFLLAHFQLACLLPRRREAVKYVRSALALAARRTPEEEVPHSGGITVGLLRETLDTLLAAEHG